MNRLEIILTVGFSTSWLIGFIFAIRLHFVTAPLVKSIYEKAGGRLNFFLNVFPQHPVRTLKNALDPEKAEPLLKPTVLKVRTAVFTILISMLLGFLFWLPLFVKGDSINRHGDFYKMRGGK